MLLLRHASAGERLSSPSLDHARGLDAVGRAHADRLADELLEHAVERIVSSPLARCVETVEKPATTLGIAVELRDELLPGASRHEIVSLLDGLPSASVVCTHREVVERLLGDDVACEKGGAWALERENGAWRPAAYAAPPPVLVVV